MVPRILDVTLLLTGMLHAQSKPKNTQNMLLYEGLDSQQLTAIYELTADLPLRSYTRKGRSNSGRFSQPDR
jgi:hypothetical protein